MPEEPQLPRHFPRNPPHKLDNRQLVRFLRRTGVEIKRTSDHSYSYEMPSGECYKKVSFHFRELLRRTLGKKGLSGVADDVLLMVGELVPDAIHHGNDNDESKRVQLVMTFPKKDEEHLKLTVRDEGCGLSKEAQERLASEPRPEALMPTETFFNWGVGVAERKIKQLREQERTSPAAVERLRWWKQHLANTRREMRRLAQLKIDVHSKAKTGPGTGLGLYLTEALSAGVEHECPNPPVAGRYSHEVRVLKRVA